MCLSLLKNCEHFKSWCHCIFICVFSSRYSLVFVILFVLTKNSIWEFACVRGAIKPCNDKWIEINSKFITGKIIKYIYKNSINLIKWQITWISFCWSKNCLETSGKNNLLQIRCTLTWNIYTYIDVLIWNINFKDKHFHTKVLALYFIKRDINKLSETIKNDRPIIPIRMHSMSKLN